MIQNCYILLLQCYICFGIFPFKKSPNPVKPRALFSEEDLYRAVEEIRHDLEIPLYVYGSSRSNVPAGFISWDDLMIASSTAEICKTHRHNYNLLTPCANIFSSGTTGKI